MEDAGAWALRVGLDGPMLGVEPAEPGDNQE